MLLSVIFVRSVTKGSKMLPDKYIYVYDMIQNRNRWVNVVYVNKYPQLYGSPR